MVAVTMGWRVNTSTAVQGSPAGLGSPPPRQVATMVIADNLHSEGDCSWVRSSSPIATQPLHSLLLSHHPLPFLTMSVKTEDTKPSITVDGHDVFNIPVEEEELDIAQSHGQSKIWAMKVLISLCFV